MPDMTLPIENPDIIAELLSRFPDAAKPAAEKVLCITAELLTERTTLRALLDVVRGERDELKRRLDDIRHTLGPDDTRLIHAEVGEDDHVEVVPQ